MRQIIKYLTCLLHHILSLIVYTFRENREFVFISIVQLMMSANSRIRFGLQIVFVCLHITPSHYHHCANFIWRHWTYEMPVRYNLSSVWVRLTIFSQLSIIQHVGLCVFSLPISFVMVERIYILCLIITIKSEVWTIIHCLVLGHEIMVCAVCLSVFLPFTIQYVFGHTSSAFVQNFHTCSTVSNTNEDRLIPQPVETCSKLSFPISLIWALHYFWIWFEDNVIPVILYNFVFRLKRTTN